MLYKHQSYFRNIYDLCLLFHHNNDKVDTISFIPRSLPGKSTYPKYQDEICHGLKIQNLEEPLAWTMHLFSILISIYPENFQFLDTNFIDKLYGSDALRLNVQAGDNVTQMILDWKKDLTQFHAMSKKYHLYP